MRLRWRVRSLMAGMAILAVLLGAAAGIERRRESFRRLAAYHFHAEDSLFERAGPLPDCGTGMTDADREEIVKSRGREAYWAYQAALYHDELGNKYLEASKRPWLPVSADPPAPPSANPELEADARWDELVNDLLDDAPGFQ